MLWIPLGPRVWSRGEGKAAFHSLTCHLQHLGQWEVGFIKLSEFCPDSPGFTMAVIFQNQAQWWLRSPTEPFVKHRNPKVLFLLTPPDLKPCVCRLLQDTSKASSRDYAPGTSSAHRAGCPATHSLCQGVMPGRSHLRRVFKWAAHRLLRLTTFNIPQRSQLKSFLIQINPTR